MMRKKRTRLMFQGVLFDLKGLLCIGRLEYLAFILRCMRGLFAYVRLYTQPMLARCYCLR